ncbi:MAG: HepT-like ribonuclease domain-containing protein [Sulfuricurvum sp.]
MSKRDVALYFRNFIIHEYFGVNAQIVWDLTRLELAELTQKVATLQKTLNLQ